MDGIAESHLSSDEHETISEDNFSIDDELGNGSDAPSGDDTGHSIKRKLSLSSDTNTRKLNGNIKKSKNELYKPPTAEEINRIKETENLYHSSLFRLQIEELLKEVGIKKKYKLLFDRWYGEFEKYIQNIPEHEEIKLSAITKCESKKLTKRQKFINDLVNNSIATKTNQDIILKFIKPASCHVFGSYKINAVVGPKLCVNINVAMPKSCFYEKDFLNNRYFIKREYYLLYIFLELKKSSLCSNVECNLMEGIITVTPNINGKISVQIHATPVEGTFKLGRCEPSINNVRAHVFDSFDDLNMEQLSESGTPYYNALLGCDMTLVSNSKFVEKLLLELENIQDAIKLISVWLKQRNLDTSDGLNYNLLVNSMVYLVLKKKINRHMSSYQVIRNFWVFLSTSNWHTEPINVSEEVSKEKLNLYRNCFDVVFLDKTGYYNLASFLNLDVYMKIRSEAELAVKFLDDVQFDSFSALFIAKLPIELQYDALLSLSDSDNFKSVYNTIDTKEKHKNVGGYSRLIINQIISTLKFGLNKKIARIVPIPQNIEQESPTIVLGLTLNPSEAYKVVEKGPIANTVEAQTFRKYWGHLSEFRRFTDGTICEAVYFKSETIRERRQIFKKMINYIVSNKLNVEQWKIVSDEFEDLFVMDNYVAPFPIGTLEEPTLRIIGEFDELSKILREFKLPLQIVAIQSTSEVFCYTNPFPPIPTNYKFGGKVTSCKDNNIILRENVTFGMLPRYVEPINCVIQLSMNSKWPKSLNVLRQIKISFYLELSKLLQKSKITSNVKPNFLEVFYKGLIFRFEIYHPKEMALMKRYTKSDGMVGYKDNEESIEMEKRLNSLPKLIGALSGIHSQNMCYGPSTALIKLWLRSHLIDEYYIPDIVIDLLNASLFLNGAPYEDANLPQVAFLRFLKHMADFDFDAEPVIVNFNNELNRDVLTSITTNFNQHRQNYPSLYIVTPYDDRKSLFSKKCSKPILNRLTLLAKSTFNIIQKSIDHHHSILKTEELFVPNLDGYNYIIHLKPTLISKRHLKPSCFTNTENKIVFEKYDEDEEQKMPVVDFDPVNKYLKELRENYGNFALFFYDSYGGKVIGVLWHQKVLEAKDFKVSHIEGHKLENNNLVTNKEAIINDFAILGQGLVKNVECCS